MPMIYRGDAGAVAHIFRHQFCHPNKIEQSMHFESSIYFLGRASFLCPLMPNFLWPRR